MLGLVDVDVSLEERAARHGNVLGWTYSSRWETLRSSSKPTMDVMLAIVDIQYVRDRRTLESNKEIEISSSNLNYTAPHTTPQPSRGVKDADCQYRGLTDDFHT
jgi:hypothetical protein